MQQVRILLFVVLFVPFSIPAANGEDPPSPFGETRTRRADAVAGTLWLSNGEKVSGNIYLTRGHRLKIYDPKAERFREIALANVKEIVCTVEKQWMEKEWRFKENANDEKVYTGRAYPAREYVHEIKTADGGSIRGPLSAVLYVELVDPKPPDADPPAAPDGGKPKDPLRYLLHKRDKGEPGQSLAELVYVTKVKLNPASNPRPKAKRPKDQNLPPVD